MRMARALLATLLCLAALPAFAASFTANRGYPQPTVGGDISQWGTELNQGTSILDLNMGGTTTVSVAGGTSVTATTLQAENLVQKLTGTLTANINYILPATGGFYILVNSTSGSGYTVTAVTSAGGSIGTTIAQGTTQAVYSDGTNVYPMSTPATPLVAWQVLTTYTVSAGLSQAIALPAGYVRYRLTLQNMTVTGGSAGSASLAYEFSSGGSYYTTGYNYVATQALTGGLTTSGSASASNVPLSALMAPVTVFDQTLDIYPGSAASPPAVRGTAYSTNTLSTLGAGWTGTAATMTSMLIFPSTGTFSGTIIVEGLP